jgi:hypothetical protein
VGDCQLLYCCRGFFFCVYHGYYGDFFQLFSSSFFSRDDSCRLLCRCCSFSPPPPSPLPPWQVRCLVYLFLILVVSLFFLSNIAIGIFSGFFLAGMTMRCSSCSCVLLFFLCVLLLFFYTGAVSRPLLFPFADALP